MVEFSPKNKFFVFYLLPVIVYMGLIFVMSSAPNEYLVPERSLGFSVPQGIKHAAEYFVLSMLLFRALVQRKTNIMTTFLLVVTLSTIYGITDEIHQAFVPTRCFSFYDMAFNFFGSVSIFPVCLMVSQCKPKEKSR